jgi:DNA-binding transcriptional regulator YhcF (GntR family)
VTSLIHLIVQTLYLRQILLFSVALVFHPSACCTATQVSKQLHTQAIAVFEMAFIKTAKALLAEQILMAIATAIESGVLAPGARLPSWLDLTAQLGVARGTVRLAYDRLSDAQLIVASRATGTRLAYRPFIPGQVEERSDPGSFTLMVTSGIFFREQLKRCMTSVCNRNADRGYSRNAYQWIEY